MVARSAIDSGNKEIQCFNKEIAVCIRREDRLQLLKSKNEKESSIDKMVTELKKAQDTLHKTIAAEKSKIEALEAKKWTVM